MTILVIAENSAKLNFIRNEIEWVDKEVILHNSKNRVAATDYPSNNHIQIDFCTANDNSKGRRVDQVFVYGNIDKRIMDVIIYPMLCGSCVPEEYQIQEIREV